MGAPGRKMALSTLYFHLTERIIIDDKEERTKPKKC